MDGVAMATRVLITIMQPFLAVEAWQIQAHRTMEPIHSKCFWFNSRTSLPLVLVTGGCDGGGKRAAEKILEMYRACRTTTNLDINLHVIFTQR